MGYSDMLRELRFMKETHYLLLPLLFLAALIIFTVLMFPLSSSSDRVPGLDFISIGLIILITILSSLVAILVFIILLASEEKL